MGNKLIPRVENIFYLKSTIFLWQGIYSRLCLASVPNKCKLPNCQNKKGLAFFCLLPLSIKASLAAQTVKHLPAMRETRVRSLGQEDPLEKEMAIHSSTRAWKIPWMDEPGRLQSMGSQSRTRLSDFTFFLSCFKDCQGENFWKFTW